MVENPILASDKVKATDEVYELYARVIAGNEASLTALTELSKIAYSCPRAAQLVERIDAAVEREELSFPTPPSPSSTKGSLFTTISTALGIVPKEAWSRDDQERLAKGERPKYYPEHPNG